MTPVFKRVVALDFYDGITSGIAQCADGRWLYVQVVAWSADLSIRVFAAAVADANQVAALLDALATMEPPGLPFWLPGPKTATAAIDALWTAVRAHAREGSEWSLLEGDDYLDSATERGLTAEESSTLRDWIRRGVVITVSDASVVEQVVRELSVA